MALTLSEVTGTRGVWGNKKTRTYDVTFDSSYADNGESLTASDIGLGTIQQVIGSVARKSDGSLAIGVSYDHTNSKLLAFVGDNDNAADAPWIEAGAVDLSTYSARLTFIGY